MHTIVGIDPGLTGGVVGIDLKTRKIIGMHPMPTAPEPNSRKNRDVIDIAELTDTIAGFVPDFVVVEFVQAMSKQGVTSTFRFGEGFGIIKGICAGLRIPFTEVRPQAWKKAAGLIGTDKDAAICAAQKAFPDRFRDFLPMRLKRTKSQCSGMADAALIGLYGAEVAKTRNIG